MQHRVTVRAYRHEIDGRIDGARPIHLGKRPKMVNVNEAYTDRTVDAQEIHSADDAGEGRTVTRRMRDAGCSVPRGPLMDVYRQLPARTLVVPSIVFDIGNIPRMEYGRSTRARADGPIRSNRFTISAPGRRAQRAASFDVAFPGRKEIRVTHRGDLESGHS